MVKKAVKHIGRKKHRKTKPKGHSIRNASFSDISPFFYLLSPVQSFYTFPCLLSISSIFCRNRKLLSHTLCQFSKLDFLWLFFLVQLRYFPFSKFILCLQSLVKLRENIHHFESSRISNVFLTNLIYYFYMNFAQLYVY